ncbi:MAG: hypothetical protein N2489_06055 [Clostridia bacterium]|nr:hypothetical protein [Clostridia bacterium]
MSIKPVDFQVMLPKTAEVAKMANDEQHRNHALQQQTYNNTQHKVDDNLRQVYAQEKTSEPGIREKQEKKRENKKEEKKKNSANYTKNKKLTADEQSSTIDIRL